MNFNAVNPGSQVINNGSIAQVIAQYGIAVLPWEATVNIVFANKGDALQKTIHVDNSYDFIIQERIFVDTIPDKDTVLNFIQINTSTSFIQNDLPINAIMYFTGWPVDWQLGVPANSDLITQLTNGQTTAVHTVSVVYRGLRVPAGYGKKIRADLFNSAS